VELPVYAENRESCTMSELYGLNIQCNGGWATLYLHGLTILPLHTDGRQEGPNGHRCYFDVFEATWSEYICEDMEHCHSHSFHFIIFKY